MGRLEDRLLNHEVHETIASLRAKVAELDEEVTASAEETSEGTLDRIPAALTYIGGALKAADPALVTATSLEGLDSSLTSAITAVDQLPSNPAVVSQLDSHIEGALDAAAPLVAASPLIAERAGEASEALSDALSKTVKSLSERTEALARELADMEERRETAETERTTADQERENAWKTQLDELSAQVSAEKQRLDQLVPNFESQFSEAQEARQTAFDAVQDELKENAASVVIELNSKFEETVDELTKSSDEVLGQVRAKRDEVEKLHGVITDTSTTGAFRKEATEQKDAADRWRRWAVYFGILAAVLAVAAVVLATVYPDRATSNSAIVAKVTATLVAAGVAAYAGRQSGRHRRREEEARRLELELIAFPPFIDSLEEDQKSAVRKDFAERAFRGRPVGTASNPRPESDPDDVVALALPELLKTMQALLSRNDRSK